MWCIKNDQKYLREQEDEVHEGGSGEDLRGLHKLKHKG